MKKILSFLFIIFTLIQHSFSQQMPIDFENSNHAFTGFSGSGFSIRQDPQNNSNTVGQFFNDGNNATQGFFIDLTRDIDVTNQKEISLSFYSFDPNQHTILLKLENGANADVEVLKTISGSANNWQSITFDFSNAKFSGNGNTTNATGAYRKLVIFIDISETKAGTYLLDNITDGSTPTDPNALDVVYNDLVWADEFNTDGPVDNTKWHHQTFGPNGGMWFNNEEQHYTNRIENSKVENGNLIITAKKETFTQNGVTLNYTSARLNSKYAFTYGRVDVRAKLPAGNGTWPAIWTLGKNISEPGAYWQTQGFGTTPWPACGELDIMEHGLHATNEVSSAIHTPSSSGNTVNTSKKMLTDVANNFHVYSMNWSPNQITFMIDGVGYYTYNPSTKNSSTWPFNLDQFLLLNVAMGGFSGTIDANFTESSMVIDYVRVYQNTNTASIDDLFNKQFTIYPNPTSNFIKIKTNKKIDNVTLYNSLGKMIISREYKTADKINTEAFAKGLYFLKITSENKTITKKVVIK